MSTLGLGNVMRSGIKQQIRGTGLNVSVRTRIVEIGIEPTVYYRKRGWCTTDLVFEHWITTDPDAVNPNGHSHTDVTIVARWETGK